MRLSTRLQSRWALSVLTGVPFGIGMAVYGSLSGQGWAGSVAMGVATGIPFGLIMGWFFVTQRLRLEAAFGTASPAYVRSVTRKVLRGEPVDPGNRAAALRVAQAQLREVLRFRPLGLIAFAAGAVLGVINALTWSPLFWLVAVGGVGMVMAEVLVPIHLRRRIALLRAPQDSS